MRKVLLFAGMLAASMAAGAATAYSVARATEKGEAYAAPSTEFASTWVRISLLTSRGAIPI